MDHLDTLPRSDAADHAARVRARRANAAAAAGLDEAGIARMVDDFYASVRADAVLGPIFAARIADWGAHLDRMKAFWRSILLHTGEFSGNPMARHIAIPGLDAAHFARWLELFYANLDRCGLAAEGRALAGGRARMIADSLLTGIAMRQQGLAGAHAGKDLPHV